MNNTLINPIEKASDIAHEMLCEKYLLIEGKEDVDKYIYQEEENGDTKSTEEAQDIFNEYYDKILEILEK
jgi:gamma-glutamyl-gamma-aminobutyrate hydrolase PuuD